MLVAFYSTTDPQHARAVELVEELNSGVHGEPFVTDFILTETLNYFVVKARDRHKPDRVARDLLAEDGDAWLSIVWIDESLWKMARERFRALSRAGLSFTDCTSLAFVERFRCRGILSFDRGFDGAVNRIT